MPTLQQPVLDDAAERFALPASQVREPRETFRIRVTDPGIMYFADITKAILEVFGDVVTEATVRNWATKGLKNRYNGRTYRLPTIRKSRGLATTIEAIRWLYDRLTDGREDD